MQTRQHQVEMHGLIVRGGSYRLGRFWRDLRCNVATLFRSNQSNESPCQDEPPLTTRKKMAHNSPGRHDRKGITLIQPQQIFPDEEAARKWFENAIWSDGEPYCPRCGCNDTHESTHKTMPYRCRPVRGSFPSGLEPYWQRAICRCASGHIDRTRRAPTIRFIPL